MITARANMGPWRFQKIAVGNGADEKTYYLMSKTNDCKDTEICTVDVHVTCEQRAWKAEGELT